MERNEVTYLELAREGSLRLGDISSLASIGGSFEIDNDGMLPEYVKSFTAPMSSEAEMSFECEINGPLFAKLTGVDLAGGRDVTAATVIFQKPYKVQVKRHRKKRINKKWAKKYGYVTRFKQYHMEDVYFEQNEDHLEIVGSNLTYIF